MLYIGSLCDHCDLAGRSPLYETKSSDEGQIMLAYITNPDMDCIKLEVATFKFGDQMMGG
jgi:hypothetical protein